MVPSQILVERPLHHKTHDRSWLSLTIHKYTPKASQAMETQLYFSHHLSQTIFEKADCQEVDSPISKSPYHRIRPTLRNLVLPRSIKYLFCDYIKGTVSDSVRQIPQSPERLLKVHLAHN